MTPRDDAGDAFDKDSGNLTQLLDKTSLSNSGDLFRLLSKTQTSAELNQRDRPLPSERNC